MGTDRREQLLEAADRVVQRRGASASMAAMAAEAGITKPVLYRYFRDKDGLLAALVERHTAALLDRLRTALATGVDLRARTEATIDAYLDTIAAEPQTYRFLVRQAGGREVAGFVRRVGELLARGLPQAGSAAPVWGQGVVGLVQGAGDWWLDHPEVLDRRQVRDALVDLLWGAFGRAGESAGGTPADAQM